MPAETEIRRDIEDRAVAGDHVSYERGPRRCEIVVIRPGSLYEVEFTEDGALYDPLPIETYHDAGTVAEVVSRFLAGGPAVDPRSDGE